MNQTFFALLSIVKFTLRANALLFFVLDISFHAFFTSFVISADGTMTDTINTNVFILECTLFTRAFIMINHKSVITFYACISILAFFTMINATSASIAINKIAIIASTFSIYRVERCRTFITLTRRFTGSTMLCTIST